LKQLRLLLELWIELPQWARQTRRPQLVLLIHGIRTHAEWQEAVAKVLKSDHRKVVRLRYHYFDVIRFLSPCFTRQAPIKKLEREIRHAGLTYPNHQLIIIAHSFGTFAISNILKERPDIQPSILVFCGGIVSESFRWDTLRNLPPTIVNECGIRDPWPVLARFSTWGYGATGRFGFGAVGVEDRFHDSDHGGYLNPTFAEGFWLPLVDRGEVIDGTDKRPINSYVLNMLSILRVFWLLPLIAILLIAHLFKFF
jgi:hypothetical protein